MTSLVLRRRGFLFSISLLSCAILSSNNNTNFYEVFRFGQLSLTIYLNFLPKKHLIYVIEQVKFFEEVIIR